MQNINNKKNDEDKITELLDKLNTAVTGLSDQEVSRRLNADGFNEITEKKKSPLLKLLGYFWGPIPLMIEAAAILSLLVHHYTDFIIIFFLLLMNTTIGFWHDRKANNAIEMLKKKLSPEAKVKRNGEWKVIPSRELTKGDIVRVRLGDIIPADIKLIEGDYLECDESALTGESMPVEKKILDDAYSGAVVTRGEASAVVTSTGLNTYFGKTAKLVEEAKTKSHFEKAVINIGHFLIVLAILLVSLIFIVALFRHDNVMETLRFAMILTVASIPVALPAILTVTMAIGAVNLTRKGAIVSRLASIEELAGMDVLCSDKTGTLTENKLTIAEPVVSESFKADDILFYSALASRKEDNDHIDNAILNKLNGSPNLSVKIADYKVKSFTPFDPVIKRTEAEFLLADGSSIKISKGAPQVIMQMCNLNPDAVGAYNNKVDEFASAGYRVIAVAVVLNNRAWELVGLLPLFDPPREDSKKTIKEAESAGVKVKMVTGDNIAIAKQISKKLGLNTNILRAQNFNDASIHKQEEMIENAGGFAEVFPEHKFTIVKVLQKLKYIVGMTGDGVNDAPALKKADCGIAVSGATDAAKSAASIVLTTPGISIIIDAIKESRKIFQRMKSYSIYRIAETVRVLLFITLSILVFNFYPVTAIMIVLLALLNDAPIIAIATDNVIYSKNPEKWNMKIVLGLGTLLGIIGVIFSFLIFYIGKDLMLLPGDKLQAFVFLKLAVAGHLTIFVARTKSHFWSIKPSKSLFWSAVSTKIIATIFAVYGWLIAPIGWNLSLLIWGYAITEFIITDFIKVYFYNYIDKIS